MPALAAPRSNFLLPFMVILIIGATLGLVLTLNPAADSLLIFWLAVGGLTLFGIYAFKGDLLFLILLWFITLIALHEEFWRMAVPFFFAITIPRLGIVVLVALLLVMILLGRVRIRHAWPFSGIMVAVAVYFFLSALITGFQTRSVVTVHYRLIGGYIFPFAVFVLVLHSFNNERDFRKVSVFFAFIGLYLTVTGWCEQLGFHALIWPRFIVDPTVGIHWGRVRGPFVMSAAMGLALVYCYFNNLVLARNLQAGRWLLYSLNLLMVPAIFWTKTRSVWLSFVFCSLIWTFYSRRRTTRAVSVALLVATLLLVAVVNMENFLKEDRSKGGLTDMEPILLRIGLAQMSWEMVKENPLFGVGFGHFRDYAPGYARDPSSPGYAFGTTALEHNNLLSIVAETGFVGLFLYVLMMLLLLRFSIRLYNRLPPRSPGMISRDLLVLYWILVAAYFIDGTFRETSDNPFANSLFFGLSAVPVALDILLSPVPIRAGPAYLRLGGPGFRPTGPKTSPPTPDRSPTPHFGGVATWRSGERTIPRPGGASGQSRGGGVV